VFLSKKQKNKKLNSKKTKTKNLPKNITLFFWEKAVKSPQRWELHLS